MTTVTIQSNKIVSNVVKVNLALLEPSCGKKHNKLFGQSNISSPFYLRENGGTERLKRMQGQTESNRRIKILP